MTAQKTQDPLQDFADGQLARARLMAALGTDDFGAILVMLRRRGLRLPRAPREGRERHLTALAEAIGDSARRFALIVTDTAPLITLAASRSLDCLIWPRIDVHIPDFVYVESLRFPQQPRGSALVDWMQAHTEHVRIEPTQVFAEFQILRSVDPATRSRGRCEQAAPEVVETVLTRHPEAAVLLLFEDSDVMRQRFILPPDVHPITTADLLAALHTAGLIASGDAILQGSVAAGRSFASLVVGDDTDFGESLVSQGGRLKSD
jgi:hypothetical protein